MLDQWSNYSQIIVPRIVVHKKANNGLLQQGCYTEQTVLQSVIINTKEVYFQFDKINII